MTKNLLMVEPHLGEEPRFFMLPTIREYAEEQLDLHGERAAAHNRFVAFFSLSRRRPNPTCFNKSAMSGWTASTARTTTSRAALTLCRDNASRAQTGLELAAALALFWLHRAYLREGFSWLEAMLARTASTD